MSAIHPDLSVAIYGHDVAREGYNIDREPLLCVSTSFGCFDGDKLYLDWDLGQRATTAAEIARTGLRPLCPDASPVYRKAPVGKRPSQSSAPDADPDVVRARGTR
jgi:hypothetical protein